MPDIYRHGTARGSSGLLLLIAEVDADLLFVRDSLAGLWRSCDSAYNQILYRQRTEHLALGGREPFEYRHDSAIAMNRCGLHVEASEHLSDRNRGRIPCEEKPGARIATR